MYGQWRPRHERAAEFDREEALADQLLDALRADQWTAPTRPDPEG